METSTSGRQPGVSHGLISLNPYEAGICGAVFARLFPADENSADATAIGVVSYLDRALAGEYADLAATYRLGLAALDHAARARHGTPFAECDPAQQDGLIGALEREALPECLAPPQGAFFALLRKHLQEGLFADPAYGGNRDTQGWRFLGHPGFWMENSAEENLARQPVTKGGMIQSLADSGFALGGGPREADEIPGYDPQRGALPPAPDADVVLVGVGAAG
ncbi:MAG: gluconate 2-dehydrogenase subunit 3 family protein, partial [Chloroflexota bacterium]|nr:gluconate 2-dehydrogenase subunit 3 family protein [Chloroflexota bacterium]